MKISELIKELQGQLETNGDLEVMTSSDYGDYCHTEELSYIYSIETCVPVDSAYSGTGLAFEEDIYGEDELPNAKEPVLILRYK